MEAPLASEAPCEFVEKSTPVGNCEATKFNVSVPVPVFLRQMFALTVVPCGTATQVTLSPVSVYPDEVAQFVVPVTPVVTAKRLVTGILTDELFWIVSWVAAYATMPATDIAIKAIATRRSLILFLRKIDLHLFSDTSKLTIEGQRDRLFIEALLSKSSPLWLTMARVAPLLVFHE